MRLSSLQKLLWKLLTSPEGVEHGIKKLSVNNLPLRANSRLSPSERLDIYANMYFFRILAVLKKDYAALAIFLGKRDFHNLITLYLQAYPPRHYSIRYAGEHLPKFLRNSKHYKKRTYLAELAELELAILTAFDAPKVNPIVLSDWHNLPQEKWPKIKFAFIPGTQILKTNYDIKRWREGLLSKNQLKGPPQKVKNYLVVWRKDLQVFIRQIDPSEWLISKKLYQIALHQNVTLETLTNRLFVLWGAKKVSKTLSQTLNSWLYHKNIYNITI